MTMPIGLALLFLMAVAPVLPWRKASGELLRDAPAVAGVDRRRRARLRRRRRRPRPDAAAGLRARRVRGRRRRFARSCWPAAVRAGGVWSAGPTAG